MYADTPCRTVWISSFLCRPISNQGANQPFPSPGLKQKVDTIVICAGQVSENKLAKELSDRQLSFHLIGGALKSAELDARRAIDQGTRLGFSL